MHLVFLYLRCLAAVPMESLVIAGFGEKKSWEAVSQVSVQAVLMPKKVEEPDSHLLAVLFPILP